MRNLSKILLSLSVLAGIVTSCGNAPLPLASGLNASGLNQDIFSILADENTASSSDAMKTHLEKFKAENPELFAQLEALKDLSPEDRKAKLQELKENNPELLSRFQGPHHGNMTHHGFGPKPGPHFSPRFEQGFQGRPPAFAWTQGQRPDFSELKDLSPEERTAKIEALKAEQKAGWEAKQTEAKAQFAEAHPELAAALEGLKDLTPEERKAKMLELKTNSPELFEGFKKKPQPQWNHRPGMNHPGMMKHPGSFKQAGSWRK